MKMTQNLTARAALLSAMLAIGGAFGVSSSFAQTVTTKPVGAVSLTVKGNSDTIVAVPLQESSAFTGVVGSTSVNGGVWSIVPSGSPSWVDNVYQGFYYVRLTSGAKNGMYYAISSNTSSALSVNSSGDDLSSIQAGDTFAVYKFWTLNTLFPFNDPAKNPLTVSASTTGPARRTQIILPDNSFSGINLPAQATYYFTSTGWKRATAGNPAAGDTLLFPDEYFIIRQPATVATDVSVTFVGSVNTDSIALALATRAAGTQDNAVALMRPADVTLAESGLDSGFLASASTTGPARRDQLFVFDNSVAGINKSASRTYYRVGQNWIRATAGNPVSNSDVLPAGSGFVIRKYQNAGSVSSIALNNPNY